jgi:hypothetical protein
MLLREEGVEWKKNKPGRPRFFANRLEPPSPLPCQLIKAKSVPASQRKERLSVREGGVEQTPKPAKNYDLWPVLAETCLRTEVILAVTCLRPEAVLEVTSLWSELLLVANSHLSQAGRGLDCDLSLAGSGLGCDQSLAESRLGCDLSLAGSAPGYNLSPVSGRNWFCL